MLVLIGGLLVSLAVLFASYAYLSNRDLSDKKIEVAEIKKNQTRTKGVSYSLKAIQSVSEDDIAAAQIKEVTGNADTIMTGGIYIPDVSLKLPIYKGFGGDHQYLGACTFAEREMGKRNYVLIGHNMKNPNLLFSPLQRVSVGMKVYLADYENVYTYEVVSKEVVHQSRGDLLEETPSDVEAIVTLMTCKGGAGTTKRTVVRGRLVKQEPLNKASAELQSVFKTK